MVGALLCAVLFGVVPAARADEQVYIWRDASGMVRFSAIENGAPCAEGDPRGAAPGADRSTDEQSRAASSARGPL